MVVKLTPQNPKLSPILDIQRLNRKRRIAMENHPRAKISPQVAGELIRSEQINRLHTRILPAIDVLRFIAQKLIPQMGRNMVNPKTK